MEFLKQYPTRTTYGGLQSEQIFTGKERSTRQFGLDDSDFEREEDSSYTSSEGSNSNREGLLRGFNTKIDDIYHTALKEKALEALAFYTSFSQLKKHKWQLAEEKCNHSIQGKAFTEMKVQCMYQNKMERVRLRTSLFKLFLITKQAKRFREFVSDKRFKLLRQTYEAFLHNRISKKIGRVRLAHSFKLLAETIARQKQEDQETIHNFQKELKMKCKSRHLNAWLSAMKRLQVIKIEHVIADKNSKQILKKGFKGLYQYLIHRLKFYRKKLLKFKSNANSNAYEYLERQLRRIMREWEKATLQQSIKDGQMALNFNLTHSKKSVFKKLQFNRAASKVGRELARLKVSIFKVTIQNIFKLRLEMETGEQGQKILEGEKLLENLGGCREDSLYLFQSLFQNAEEHEAETEAGLYIEAIQVITLDLMANRILNAWKAFHVKSVQVSVLANRKRRSIMASVYSSLKLGYLKHEAVRLHATSVKRKSYLRLKKQLANRKRNEQLVAKQQVSRNTRMKLCVIKKLRSSCTMATDRRSKHAVVQKRYSKLLKRKLFRLLSENRIHNQQASLSRLYFEKITKSKVITVLRKLQRSRASQVKVHQKQTSNLKRLSILLWVTRLRMLNSPPKLCYERIKALKGSLHKKFAFQRNLITDYLLSCFLKSIKRQTFQQVQLKCFTVLKFNSKSSKKANQIGRVVKARTIRKRKRFWMNQMLKTCFLKYRVRNIQLKSCSNMIQAFFDEIRTIRRRNLILKFYKIKNERVYFNRIKAFALIRRQRRSAIAPAFQSFKEFTVQSQSLRKMWRLRFTFKLWLKFKNLSKTGALSDEFAIFKNPQSSLQHKRGGSQGGYSKIQLQRKENIQILSFVRSKDEEQLQETLKSKKRKSAVQDKSAEVPVFIEQILKQTESSTNYNQIKGQRRRVASHQTLVPDKSRDTLKFIKDSTKHLGRQIQTFEDGCRDDIISNHNEDLNLRSPITAQVQSPRPVKHPQKSQQQYNETLNVHANSLKSSDTLGEEEKYQKSEKIRCIIKESLRSQKSLEREQQSSKVKENLRKFNDKVRKENRTLRHKQKIMQPEDRPMTENCDPNHETTSLEQSQPYPQAKAESSFQSIQSSRKKVDRKEIQQILDDISTNVLRESPYSNKSSDYKFRGSNRNLPSNRESKLDLDLDNLRMQIRDYEYQLEIKNRHQSGEDSETQYYLSGCPFKEQTVSDFDSYVYKFEDNKQKRPKDSKYDTIIDM